MMKISACIFSLLLVAFIGHAQSFMPVHSPVLEQEVAFEMANECYIFFDNFSGDTLQLRWRSLSVNAPEDWVIDLCDYGLCYAGIPANGTMNPVYDTIQPYLKLVVQPGTSPGSAWIWFRVFEKDNEDNYVDVFFSLFSPGTTGSAEPDAATFEVYPNPASDLLFLENKNDRPRWARLLDAAGRTVWGQSIGAGGQATIEVSAFSEGWYFLRTAGSHQTQKILIQR